MKCRDCLIQSKSTLCPLCRTILEVESYARQERFKEEAMAAQMASEAPETLAAISERLQRKYDVQLEELERWKRRVLKPNQEKTWAEIARERSQDRYWL